MIDTPLFFEALDSCGIAFFAGVPDSLLKPFCAHLSAHVPESRHVIAANEGGALALAAGHYLATRHPALVYMQNSGLGNAVNPIVSLADPDVYSLPAVLLVGWRGEPGTRDEPQHLKQGGITPALCETLGVPYRILPTETEAAIACLREMAALCMEARRPVAMLVRAGSFSPSPSSAVSSPSPYPINREAAVAAVAAALPSTAVVVSTTGHISRELFEFRAGDGHGHARDFLTVGSMGHASQIALGIALAQPERPVVCLDGDGAVLMHMGALAIAGTSGARNLLHIVLNNGAHDSVGGQPTAGFRVDFVRIADACGYPSACRIERLDELPDRLAAPSFGTGPRLIEIRVAKGARKNLGRPTRTPEANKEIFMETLAIP